MNKPAQSIQIGNKTISRDRGIFLIAEMACAHDGDVQKARAIIEAAIAAGADAVQLQFFEPDANMVRKHSKYPLLEKLYIPDSDWWQLITYAKENDILVFACAYDEPSLEKAIDWRVDGIKFNSSDLTNFPMLAKASESGIFFTLGTGASSFKEIDAAVEHCLSAGGRDFVLMHGVQSFPTKMEQASVSRVAVLSQRYQCLVGYADHTDGDLDLARYIDLLAIGAGSCVLEKHITFDRAEKGVDHESALDPASFYEYARNVRDGFAAFRCSDTDAFTADELNYRRFQKKKIVARCDLKQGTILTAEDISFLRTEDDGGLTPDGVSKVLGNPLNRDIGFQELVGEESIVK